MKSSFTNLYSDALDLLHQLCTSNGILASTIEADNYKRIWARDSIVCGLAGLWIDDSILINGLKNSLLTLAKHQHPLGMIPSNVDPKNNKISYGSLIGRIDASTWFIVGASSYFKKTEDSNTWNILLPAIEKCRQYLQAAEHNAKGWLYTPLSGNWADEYPIHGYTLYDNMLRLWGEKLFAEIDPETAFNVEELTLKNLINFWPNKTAPNNVKYHPEAFNRIDFENLQHFIAFILPGHFDKRFDAAGNALALLNFELAVSQKKQLSKYINQLASDLSQPLIPAFWPIISKESSDWELLKGNYSYDFKNTPGDFHNGGVWPVWMGLFCLGLAKNGMHQEVEKILNAFNEVIINNEAWDFQEYINPLSSSLKGKTQMGYTASGIVFMKLALQEKS